MGFAEIQALVAKRTGNKPEETTHVEVKPTGPKEKKPLRQVSLKKQKEQRETKKAGGDPRKNALNEWFELIAKEEAGDCMCWECGKPVHNKFIRNAIAHIFPKSIFHSVETHPLNYLILPDSCCHEKSHTVARFTRMQIWSEAVDRFIQFEPHLTDKERRHKYYILFFTAARESFPDRFPQAINKVDQ